MDVGFLLLLNISTVPLLYEFEQLGSSGTSSVASLLTLRHFRRARWSWGFGLLWFLFLALTLAPTASGVRYEATFSAIATVITIQICLWGYTIYKVKSVRRNEHRE